MTIHTTPPVHMVFDYAEWMKAFGWGFLSFPVVYYIIRIFGKQIWADVSAIWDKYIGEARTDVKAEVAKVTLSNGMTVPNV